MDGKAVTILFGTYSVILKEAQKYPEDKITVIDSKNNSGAQELILLRATEAIAA